MRLLAKIFISLFLLIGAIVVWFHLSFPTVSYRYRLTIAVETDGQIHSGSSVIEVWTRFNPHWAAALMSGKQLNFGVQGQAVLIELGKRGALVAALRSGTGNGYLAARTADVLADYAFLPLPSGSRAPGYPVTLENQRALSRMQGIAELKPNDLPLFIWFPNPRDSNSAQMVKPTEFANVIGDKTRLVSAQVQMTYDPIVIDLEKRLPAFDILFDRGGGLRLDRFLLGRNAFIDNGAEK